MLKLLILPPMLLFGSILLGSMMFGIGALLLLPLLALLPGLIAVGAGVFAVVLTFAVLWLVLRLIGAILIGVVGVVGFAMLLAAGAIMLALGAVLAHLLLPLLFVFGLIWLIRRGAKPAPSAIAHG